MTNKNKIIVGLLFAIAFFGKVFAVSETQTTQYQNGQISTSGNDGVKDSQLLPQAIAMAKQQAQSWGMNLTDYQHYQQLMSDTKYGTYYKDQNLDPNFVLAIAATDGEDYQRYLTQAARNEHDRDARELQVNRDFHNKILELYPNEKPIVVGGQP